MTLNPHPTYPAAGHYVLRLRQDALPQAGHLAGRVQHVSSGECGDFVSGPELLEWLTRHAAQMQRRAGE
ncbi:MAG: hypothetical protein JO006_16455 [Paucibacter sp.]|nr:hypothetical protein [Roseateles sp.]